MKRLVPLLIGLTSLHALADETQIRKALGEAYPEVKITHVQPTSIAGIYEIMIGGKLVYSDQTGEHLLLGPLVETRTKTNLTEKRLDVLNKVDFNSLPFDKAIKVVKGSGERKLAIFSDPDCPFCQRLEKELAQVDNVTVYVFLNPLTSLHPHALEHANEIWCAKDRAKNWNDYMLEGKAPVETDKCDTPVSEILNLSASLGIEGTPAIIFSNGKRVDGMIPAAKIEDLLGKGS